MKLFLREKSSDRVILLWCIYCIAEIVSNKAKGWISKRVFQENKAPQIFRKTNISYALIHAHTCAYQGVRNVCFSENLTWFVFFLKQLFWDLPFCLITDEMKVLPGKKFTHCYGVMTTRLGIGVSIQVSWVQNHMVAPTST